VAERLGGFASRHPDRVLAGLALIAIAGVALVATGQDRLGLGEAPAAATAEVRISGDVPVSSAPFRVGLRVIRSRLAADPGVAAIRPPSAASAGRVARLTIVLAGGAGASETLARLESRLDPGILEVRFVGPAATLREARENTLSDLQLLLLAVPLAGLLAAGLLGPRHALAALIATAAAVFGAAALCLALSLVAELSVLALVGAACGGPLALLRVCWALQEGRGPALLSAAAGIAVLAAPGLAGPPHLESLALGGVLSGLLAVPAAALAAPAARALWSRPPTGAGRHLATLAGALTRRRVVAVPLAVLAALGLAALAAPLAGLETRSLLAGAPEPERWWLAVAVAGAVVCAAALAVRRAPVAILSALSTALAPAAAGGLCVLAFQDGGLAGMGEIESGPLSPAALFAGLATVGACSAAATVATLAARRRTGTGTPPDGTAATAAFSTPIVVTELVAALLAAPLIASAEPFLQQFALVIAGGMLLDLLLVRALVLPALPGSGGAGGGTPAGGRLGLWARRRRTEAETTSG
jgi:hypothetical protein